MSRSRSRERPRELRAQVRAALTALEATSTKRDRENLARFGITAKKAFGVSMANIQALAKRLGRSHELAGALWKTGWYEARMLTSFVDEPSRVTPAQMDRWCRDFDNWGICDTVCFHLFDRTPHAWTKVVQWHDRRGEFVKRAAFRAPCQPRAARQAYWGRAVHREPGARRARRRRRTELREKGRELGRAPDRTTQSCPQHTRRDGGSTTRRVSGCRSSMGGEGCSQGAHEPDGVAPAAGPPEGGYRVQTKNALGSRALKSGSDGVLNVKT
jgi:DNA alkylation repair enzyme